MNSEQSKSRRWGIVLLCGFGYGLATVVGLAGMRYPWLLLGSFVMFAAITYTRCYLTHGGIIAAYRAAIIQRDQMAAEVSRKVS
ncbi:MAG: hypothetical protein AAGH99_09090 [Planctomycetota bacterium]